MTKAQNFYRIKNWLQRHSSGEQRRRKGCVIEMPTRMDSEGLQFLMESTSGRSAFAVYVLLAEFAGTLPASINGSDTEGNCTGEPVPHLAGVLFDDRGPYDATRLARKLPAKANVIAAALKMLTSPEVGWVDQISPDDLKAQAKRQDDANSLDAGATQTPSKRGASAGAQSPTISDESEQTELGRLLKYLKVPKRSRPAICQIEGLTWQQVVSHMVEIKSDESVRQPGGVLAKRLLDQDDAKPFTLGILNRCLQQGIIKTLMGHKASSVTVSAEGVFLPDHVGACDFDSLTLEG